MLFLGFQSFCVSNFVLVKFSNFYTHFTFYVNFKFPCVFNLYRKLNFEINDIYDCLSENLPSSYLPVFQEIPF